MYLGNSSHDLQNIMKQSTKRNKHSNFKTTANFWLLLIATAMVFSANFYKTVKNDRKYGKFNAIVLPLDFKIINKL